MMVPSAPAAMIASAAARTNASISNDWLMNFVALSFYDRRKHAAISPRFAGELNSA
jgi:hypothetical protein